MTMNYRPEHITNLPCEEVTPVEPFPFASPRISRGIKFKHYLIFFPFYAEYKKCQHLYTFNLETLEWFSVKLRDSPQILENSSSYSIIPYLEDNFILFGCYKTFAATRTNNLFSQTQAPVLNRVLGFINTQIIEGQLVVKWEELKSTPELPYLEGFSASAIGGKLCIFGGRDENENLTNRLIKYDMTTATWEEVHLYNKTDGTEENIPCARQGHESFTSDGRLYIMGGQDKDSNMIYDLWQLMINMEFQNLIGCRKIEKELLTRVPKMGTPSFGLERMRYYIAKSHFDKVPPIRSYLVADEIYSNANFAKTFYSADKKHYLPFNGIPHTMELFHNYIIMGYESSIYAISIDGKPLEPSSPAVDFDSHMMSLANKRKQKSYKEHMREYFEERPFPDVVFKFEGEGEEISAHRGILSVRSKYFHDLFTSGIDQDKSVIEISDWSAAAFLTLLEWLYCDSVKEMKEDVAVELLKTGEKYSVEKLKNEAEKCLMKSLTSENILERTNLAIEFGAKDLEKVIKDAVLKKMTN